LSYKGKKAIIIYNRKDFTSYIIKKVLIRVFIRYALARKSLNITGLDRRLALKSKSNYYLVIRITRLERYIKKRSRIVERIV